MNRRTFIAAAPALAGAAALKRMKALNLPELGLVGGGQLYRVSVLAPAAGAQLTWQQPDQFAFEPLTISTSIICAVAVANRLPIITVNIPTTVEWQQVATLPFTASQAGSINWGQQFGAAVFSQLVSTNSLPRIIMPPGAQWFFSCLNIQAADQLGNLEMFGLAYPLA